MLKEDPKIPVTEVYAKSLALLQDPAKHAKGNYSFDKEGNPCAWAEGHSFCAIGTLILFSEGYCFRSTCCLQRVYEFLFNDCIQSINDSEDGYPKVMQAMKFAKELWTGYEPSEEELSLPIPALIEKRKNVQ